MRICISSLFLLLVSLLCVSCGTYFDSKYYYYNHSVSLGPDIPSPEPPDMGGGDDGELSPEEDPFITGEWNNPDYNGFAINLDDYLIEASFDAQNRPSYRLVRGSSWQASDAKRREYYYHGANTQAGGVTMNSVRYYLYKGSNPNFSPDSAYNASDRLNRFYFYRFTGSAAGQKTDNYLIAIDSRSKLVFAFGVPTSWKKIIGIPAPTAWGPVELGWEADADTNRRVSFAVDGLRYFYEYDPVGILKSDGSIEIYQWCLDSIGNHNRYAPRFDGIAGDNSRAIASYGSPGRSPYVPVSVAQTQKDRLTIQVVSLKNISVKSREKAGLIVGAPQNQAWLTYTIAASAYDGSIEKDLEGIEIVDPASSSLTGAILLNKTKTVKTGQALAFSSDPREFILEETDKNGGFIELAARVDKYNKQMLGFADTDKFGSHGSGRMASLDSPRIILKFDSDRGCFSLQEIRNNADLASSIVCDAQFTLFRGETKDLGITYTWLKGNDTKNGESFEITYRLSFDQVEGE